MQFPNNLAPQDCQNMNDIRVEIDAMDQAIIAILGKRYKYVQAAAKFKTSQASVRASERFQSMLTQRRVWAKNHGLNEKIIEKIYTDLVNHFIAEEMKAWQKEGVSSDEQ